MDDELICALWYWAFNIYAF